MNPTPKTVKRVNVAGARKLTPLEMNGMQFNTKRTLLTADYLEKLIKRAASAQGAPKSASGAKVEVNA